MQVEADDGPGSLGLNRQGIKTYRVQREQKSVGMVTLGRARAAVARRPKVVRVSNAPAGSPAPLAPAVNEVTSGGMLTTIQCQNPLPVGASGSKHVRAKLRVPPGGLTHDS